MGGIVACTRDLDLRDQAWRIECAIARHEPLAGKLVNVYLKD